MEKQRRKRKIPAGYLSIQEAGKNLDVSYATVVKLVNQGKLLGSHNVLTGRRYVEEKSFSEFLNQIKEGRGKINGDDLQAKMEG